MGLKDEQQRAARFEALGRGDGGKLTVEEIGRAVGRSRRTITYWRTLPEYQDEVKRLQGAEEQLDVGEKMALIAEKLYSVAIGGDVQAMKQAMQYYSDLVARTQSDEQEQEIAGMNMMELTEYLLETVKDIILKVLNNNQLDKDIRDRFRLEVIQSISG